MKHSGILVAVSAVLFIAAAGADACPGRNRNKNVSILSPKVVFSQTNVQTSLQNQSQSSRTSGGDSDNDFSRQRQRNRQRANNEINIGDENIIGSVVFD